MANGWDPLLQTGLQDPTIQQLDELAGDIPVLIMDNSAHSVFFNTAAAKLSGVDKNTPDPPGASYGRDAQGNLTGAAYEAAAIERLTEWYQKDVTLKIPKLFEEYHKGMRRVGYTTISDLSWQAKWNVVAKALKLAHLFPIRLRTYEMSSPGGAPSVDAINGDEVFRQVGAKLWADGSPGLDATFHNDGSVTPAEPLRSSRGSSQTSRSSMLTP